jgi:hypothetical protein
LFDVGFSLFKAPRFSINLFLYTMFFLQMCSWSTRSG